jgi:hypothetical protein
MELLSSNNLEDKTFSMYKKSNETLFDVRFSCSEHVVMPMEESLEAYMSADRGGW